MWLKWTVAALAATEAGYMLLDGARALVVGDYMTPGSGEHAGELGPWTHLVAAVGIDPRSTLMKSLFVVYGLAWIAVIAAFVAESPWAWRAMLVAAVGSLWYAVLGSIVSALVVGLLLLPPVRALFAGS